MKRLVLLSILLAVLVSMVVVLGDFFAEDPVDTPTFEAAVPFAGTFLVPEAWDMPRVSLTFEPMDFPDSGAGDRIKIGTWEMKKAAGEPGLYRWSAGDVLPGRYMARVYLFHFQQVLHVPPTGLTDAHLEIGTPAEVTVRVLEEDTGIPVALEGLHWNCVRPEGSRGGSMESAEPDDTPGVFHFTAPVGRVEIGTMDDSYMVEGNLHEGSVQEIRPGENEITLTAVRTCGILISVLEDETPLDFVDAIDHLQVRGVGGDGMALSLTSTREAARYTVSGAGMYEILFEGNGVFEEASPSTVQIPRGEFVEHVVNVRRIK